jgi:hypothetical protein
VAQGQFPFPAHHGIEERVLLDQRRRLKGCGRASGHHPGRRAVRPDALGEREEGGNIPAVARESEPVGVGGENGIDGVLVEVGPVEGEREVDALYFDGIEGGVGANRSVQVRVGEVVPQRRLIDMRQGDPGSYQGESSRA